MWPTVLRILFVIDGRIDTSTCPECFGLGYVLQTLRDDSFAWWVRFKVQVVRRDQARQTLLNCSSQDSDANCSSKTTCRSLRSYSRPQALIPTETLPWLGLIGFSRTDRFSRGKYCRIN
jgi:hypothetical protein